MPFGSAKASIPARNEIRIQMQRTKKEAATEEEKCRIKQKTQYMK
jgi:hypothetical protein